MSGRKLDQSYISLMLQLGAHRHAREAALRPNATAAFLVELGLSDLVGALSKSRRKIISERFEVVGRQIRRQGFIDLVSAFESDAFRLLGIASSKVRHVLNQHYEPSYPFYLDREQLARTTEDFSNLGGYRKLLAKRSSSQIDPRMHLWQVVSHRDFLVHGERWE